MASCFNLRHLTCSATNSHRQIHRKLCQINTGTRISSSQIGIFPANENGTNMQSSQHECGNTTRQYSTALGTIDNFETIGSPHYLNLENQHGPDVTSQFLSKLSLKDLCKYLPLPEFEKVQNDTAICKKSADPNSVRVFKLPPDSLWYPPGAQRFGSNVLCSISFSPQEQEVLDESFESISESLQSRCDDSNSAAINFNNLEPYPMPGPSRVINIASIINNNDIKQRAIDWCNSSINKQSNNVDNENEASPGTPDNDQLEHIKTKLIATLPSIFNKSLDYTIYDLNMVFENNLRDSMTHGLPAYIKQILMLRIVAFVKFASVKFYIISTDVHPEDGTVTIRWKINGVSGIRAIFKLITTSIYQWGSLNADSESWYEGFSTFSVNSKGLIYHHRADAVGRAPRSETGIKI